MSFEKLEIHLLAPNGKVERRIRCFAGRVTVLRESRPGDLESYTRALAGLPAHDRFSIIIDGANYDPRAHTLIGFGEHFSSDGKSVRDYLREAGAPEIELETLALDHGLGGSLDRRCAELTPPEERILRLLAATFRTDRLIVLNDPFKDVDPAWIEKLADRLATYAWRERTIVLVINLSTRPEVWIDNELIARIQIGGQRRRTIGFGAAAPELNELIQQVRSEALEAPAMITSDAPSPPVHSEPLASGVAQLFSGRLLKPQAAAVSAQMPRRSVYLPLSILATVVVTASVVSLLLPRSPSESVPVANLTPPHPAPQVEAPAGSAPSSAVVPASATGHPMAHVENGSYGEELAEGNVARLPAPDSVLHRYDPKLVRAIMRAYDEVSPTGLTLTAVKTDGGVTKLTPKRRAEEGGELSAASLPAPANIFAEVPESASPSEGRYAPEEDRADTSDDVERRREAIRQRFLEAIERSAGPQ